MILLLSAWMFGSYDCNIWFRCRLCTESGQRGWRRSWRIFLPLGERSMKGSWSRTCKSRQLSIDHYLEISHHAPVCKASHCLSSRSNMSVCSVTRWTTKISHGCNSPCPELPCVVSVAYLKWPWYIKNWVFLKIPCWNHLLRITYIFCVDSTQWMKQGGWWVLLSTPCYTFFLGGDPLLAR